eukprot:g4902.t1
MFAWMTLEGAVLLLILGHLSMFEDSTKQWVLITLALRAITAGMAVPAFLGTAATFAGFGLLLAMLPTMPRKCALGSLVLGVITTSVASSMYELPDLGVQLIFCASALIFAYRMYVVAMTFVATAKATLAFPLLPHLFPAYSFTRERFFRADAPPEEVAERREKAFNRMQEHWDGKWPKSLEVGKALRGCFSDLRFAAGNRVFLPFAKILDQWCDPVTVVDRVDRMVLTDVDGHENIDIAGSYGVNVVGYERYKKFITDGWELTKNVGCVLGPVHPILMRNIEILKEISGKEEVSFHMSGTEAVMSCVRLARFNTGRKLIVLFGGAYHGWWDGVQPIAGNERIGTDILTLVDLSPASLAVIKMRAHEIAAVLVNPLQSFHPNQPPPSDLVLATDNRNAKESDKYKNFLGKLREVCSATGIVFVFDEVYTGFRLAPGGAQEYFGVSADMVCYGKTLGGGMPNGIVCGPSALMNRSDAGKPLRVAYVIGTFAAHPLLLGSMNGFLEWVRTDEARALYAKNRKMVADWSKETNALLEKEGIPLRTASYASVWTMLYKQPGRYHWMLQYYLKDEGINLSWVGTGRLNFSLDFEEQDLELVRGKMIAACRRMKEDGWWWYDPEQAKKNAMKIKLSLGLELLTAFVKTRILGFFAGGPASAQSKKSE